MQVSVPLIVSFVLARRLVPSLKWKNIETNKSQTMPPNQKILNNGDLSMDIALGSNEDERNDDDILSCAILGCGMMGQEHISYIQGFKDTVRIDFLVDPFQPSLDKAQKIMKEFQLPECPATCRSSPTHVPMFLKDEMELLMHSKNIDLLVIATPNYLHTDVLERWGKEDITILVEKPVAVNLEQLQRLQELKQDPGFKARIWVAMEYRYIPAIAKLMSLIPETVGDIKMITIRENRYPFLHKIGNWNRDPMKTGDTLVEKCCHFFDLFRLITKQEIDLPNVRALAQRGLNYRNESFLADGIDYPIIDAAYVTMPFEERSGNKNRTVNHDLDMIQMMNNKTPGTMGCLELCMYAEGSRHQEEIIVTGTKGRLEAYLPENKVFSFKRPSHELWSDRSVPPPPSSIQQDVYDCSDVKSIHGIEQELPTHGGYHYSSTAVEWYRLLEAIKVYKETGIFIPEVSLNDGMRAVEIGLQATEAILND